MGNYNLIQNNYENKEKKQVYVEETTELTEEEISAFKEKAHECRVLMWGTADETIQSFLDYVKDGENCYCELNWKKIYSIDLINMSKKQGCNLEDAFYLVFYWKTKIEQEKEQEKYRQKYKAKRKKEELEALEKIPWLVEEGKKYVDETKWSDWEEFVEYAARGTYHWKEVELVLKLLEMIDNWDSRQNIQKIFDNEWGEGWYYSIVRNRVVYYSKKWKEANKNLARNY